MLRPKQTKFRVTHKGRITGIERRSSRIIFGDYALKALEAGRIDSKQIEATRRAIARHVKKTGKVWVRVFPDIPVSAKPIEVRMGKGKGNVDHFICRVKPGKILYEITGVSLLVAKKILKLGANKLPILTRIISRL